MKKHIYKLVASMVIGTMLLSTTACSSGEAKDQTNIEQKVPMGRYVEHDIKLPDGIGDVLDYWVQEDGMIKLYGYDKNDKFATYTQKEEGSWEQKEAEWYSTLMKEEKRLLQIAESPEGNIYMLYTDNAYNSYLGKVVGEKEIEEIPFNVEDGGPILSMQIATDGDIFVGMQYSGVARIDVKSGAVVAEYISTGSDGEFAITKDQAMLLDVQRGGVVVFDLVSGNEESFIPYEGNLWGSKLLANEEGITYLMNEEGVNRLAPGGSVWETVIEGQMSAFGMPSFYLREGALKNNEEFVVLFTDQAEGYVFARYAFDPSTPAKPTTEINLYMLEDNMTIRQAVAKYQRQNREVLINLQVGIEKGNAITKSDAIRTLNTQLLAGKGPDLLVLDGLPIQSYIDKGVLLDMSGWASERLENKEWLENIAGAYRQEDGAIYALPTRFEIPTIWGNKDIVQGVHSLKELATWADENAGKQVFYNMTPEQLIKKLYGLTAHTWLDEKGQIKEEAFISFLEAINMLADKDAPVDKEEYILDTLAVEYMAHKDVEVYVQDIKGFSQLPYYYSAIMQRGEGDFSLALDKEGGVFNPKGIIGINASSEYTEIAEEIAKIALSKQVQKVDLNDGMPVEREVFETQAKIDNSSMGMMAMPMSMEKPIQMQPASQASYTQLKEQVEKLVVPAMTDEVLMHLIIEETKGYFDGEKTAEEAATAVATRTRAYLAE
ncbi:MAG: hypothetical protein RR887_10460 [Niameybacter sp.]